MWVQMKLCWLHSRIMICGGKMESERGGAGLEALGVEEGAYMKPRHVAVVVVLRSSRARSLWFNTGLTGAEGTTCWRHKRKLGMN